MEGLCEIRVPAELVFTIQIGSLYNPNKHHRQSIRLKGYDYASPGAYFITICTHQRQCLFGEIVDGEMQLNPLGQMVNACWQRLPSHFSDLALDAFIVMPNHIHGILVLTNSGRGTADSGRGAALDQGLADLIKNANSNATPSSNAACNINLPEPGVAFGQEMIENPENRSPNAAPLRTPRLGAGTVGAIILNFKSVTNRTRNRVQRSTGGSIWQRNYYEHIIRSEESLLIFANTFTTIHWCGNKTNCIRMCHQSGKSEGGVRAFDTLTPTCGF